jgi:chemotaxis protein MotB
MIRRRREEHDSKTGHERWLVSYADFVTLLFGFFVVMYSVSQVSEQKYRVLSETLSTVFQGNTSRPAQMEISNDGNPQNERGKISGLSPNLVDTRVLARELEDALIHLVQPGQVRITATEEWVQIDLNANLLFDSASAEPKPDARTIFRQIAEKLAPFANQIEVSGHTDSVPIRTAKFHSNWELSSARASAVVRLLADDGVDPRQLSAVGFGEYRPVADNGTEEGRAANRRVVLMVARHAVERPTLPLEDIPATLPEAAVDAEAPAEAEASLETEAPKDAEIPLKAEVPAEPSPVKPPEPAAEPAPPEVPGVAPVRLKSGGLLFTSDPEPPRKAE